MRTRDAIRQAKKDGREAGINAASWCYDGNTNPEWYAKVLRGIENGDPEILDGFRTPNLSGEMADDPTPRSLAEDYGIGEDRSDVLDEICSAWEDAASMAFWDEIERICRSYVAA